MSKCHKSFIKNQLDKLIKISKIENKLHYFLGVISANQTTETLLEEFIKESPDMGLESKQELKNIIRKYKEANEKGMKQILEEFSTDTK